MPANTGNIKLRVEAFVAHQHTANGKNLASSERAGRVILRFSEWAASNADGAFVTLTPRLFVMWLSQARSEGATAATLRARYFAGKAFFQWLHGDVHMPEFSDYRLPSLPPPVPHALPAGMDGVRAMLAHADSGAARDLIALQGFAGLRVSEARALTRENIDNARNEIVVRGKGEKTRRVPISRELRQYLDAMPKTGKLVTLSDSGARVAVSRIAALAGVESADGGAVSSHDLRATFATEVYKRTKDILLVSRLLGHASTQTTQIYIANHREEMRAAVDFS